VNILEEISKYGKGADLLIDWWGSGGKPVDRELAQSRANVCLDCSENKFPRYWETLIHPIGAVIRGQLEIKNKLSLHLEREDDLHLCRICGCCNQLAPWAPIERLKEHTDQETLEKFPDWCWKKKEILAL
jgi:hypothetical protein